MKIDKNNILKVLLIMVPTYLMAYLTEQMVYTIPMLAITSFLASNLNPTNHISDDSGESDA